MTLFPILTAVVAVYDALLSSATSFLMLRSKGWRTFMYFGLGFSEPADIKLHIANSGERLIIINEIMLYVIQKHSLFWLPRKLTSSKRFNPYFATDYFFYMGGLILGGDIG